MDPTAFEIWLGEIAALTETQRRLACQALVLSEVRAAVTSRRLASLAGDFDRAEDEPLAGSPFVARAASDPGWRGQCRRTWATPRGQRWVSSLRQP